VMPSFSFLEEFSVIRAKYKTAFSDLMQAAARTTGTDVRHIQCRASVLKKLCLCLEYDSHRPFLQVFHS